MEFKLLIVLCVGMMLMQSTSSHHHHGETCRNDQTAIVDVINHVAFSVAEKLEEPGNTFFSPLGLSMALGMAYLGARENTAHQMEHALAYNSSNISGQQVHDGMKQLCEETVQRAIDYDYSLNIANGLFQQEGSAINEEYVQGIENNYHGKAISLDFVHQAAESTATINEWVKEKTANKIEGLFGEPLPPETKLVLTNAIYFKGNWKIEFPEGRTYDGRFYVAETQEWKTTPLMSLAEERFPFLQDEETGYQYLEMPYKGDKVSMIFALPMRFDALPDLHMNESLFCRIRMQMVETELKTVTIPKFKFTYEKKMKDTLRSMGLVDAFIPEAADLGGINTRGLYISEVIHKAVIEVNERGSEAAAVTGIQIMPIMMREITEFIANHAFLFYIMDTTSGAILFSGKMIDPSISDS